MNFKKESMNAFDLSKNDVILLYGDNFISRPLYKKLRNDGFCVKAIIDRKYVSGKTEADGLKLLCIESLSENEFSKNSVVIVCMSNGLTQESVINGLAGRGYEKIIYLPMLNNRPILEQDILRRAYSGVMSGDYENVFRVPKTSVLSESQNVIIYRNEIETAFLCPVSVIHAGTEELFNEQKLPLDYKIARKYFDVPINQDDAFKGLFYFLMGNPDYPSEYLEMMRQSESERKELLEDRKKLFRIYEQNYEYNFNFFLYSPIRAEWNEEGYLNILDGHHRCIYLLCKGKKTVPLSVKNGDYEKLIKAKILPNMDE